VVCGMAASTLVIVGLLQPGYSPPQTDWEPASPIRHTCTIDEIPTATVIIATRILTVR